jgi:hypothetical protein
VDPADIDEELSREQMILQSSINLEVPLVHLNDTQGTTNFEDNDDDEDGYDDGQPEFVWDRCLPDQMFVFNENDIPRILNAAITSMVPQRSHSQKPIPANCIFLGARYAHYYGNSEVLENFLDPALQRIRVAVLGHRTDLAYLAFWLSNCSLLLYYIRKDPGLSEVTSDFQQRLSEMISDIYVLVTRDVVARLERVLDPSILDHETIPGLNNVQFQHEWRLFRSKAKQISASDEVKQVTLPPSMEQKMKPSPRNVTSILSSALFVMDLYDVHPIITQEIISQILYWLGAALFNRIMSNRKYLARSRAMQIRLNVSAIEDWARNNNRRPEDADEFHTRGSAPGYASVLELCRQHLASVVQILQWLQCFTGFGDDFTNVVTTLQQLKNLNPQQLIHVAKKYRPEVGEKPLSKEYKAYLNELAAHYDKAKAVGSKAKGQRSTASDQKAPASTPPPPSPQSASSSNDKKVESEEAKKTVQAESDMGVTTDSAKPAPEGATKKTLESANKSAEEESEKKTLQDANGDSAGNDKTASTVKANGDTTDLAAAERLPVRPTIYEDESEDERDPLYLDALAILPFVIPTLREMIVTWGAGLGGTHAKRARRYEPSLSEEFLEKFETDGTSNALNPLFTDIAVPQASVHKGWGEDPEIDDMNGAWS